METLNFGIIQQDFDNLLTATKNKLDRELTSKYPNKIVNGGKFTVLSLFSMSVVNYGGVVALCQISEEQNLNLYLSTPSLNRGIVENLFSLIYLLFDFPENNKLFIKNSLREKKELLDFYKEHYGDNSKWKNYLNKQYSGFQKYEEFVENVVGLTQDEKENMQNMKRFPRVSAIVKFLEKNNYPDFKFFKYLEKYHYTQLSHLAHSQPAGLIATGTIIEKPNKEAAQAFITRQRWIAVTLIMSIISEVELHFEYDLKTRIAYIWGILEGYSSYAREVYELRYRELLVS